MLRVIEPGLLTTIQDRRRFGSARLGIGHAGAADVPAWRLANALVGNAENTAALEMTLNGPVLETDADIIVALTGATLPNAQINDAPLPAWRPVAVAAGSRLTLGPMSEGCRSYLAIAGGIDLSPWRGSRATDVNAALGPRPHPLTAGDTLKIGGTTSHLPAPVSWSLDPRPWFDTRSPHIIRLLAGSHTSRLDAASQKALGGEDTWTVGSDSNRVGMRLDGPHLALSAPLDMLSEGVTAGTVQLPPDGRAIIMGPEHPVTGGYPRIGQVIAVDLPRLAQCRPGDEIAFEWADLAQAMEWLTRRDTALERLIARIGKRRQST
jgi:antagonist of KipI